MSGLPPTYQKDDTESDMLLEEKSIEGVAKYIQSKDCKRVFVMTGAGISTSAGIPDFRSPDTGLYANLARLKLPYPEAVFDIRYFRKNPLPFYTLAHELAPGRYRPTKTHSFIRLLHEKSYLEMCFTQNIDTLERRAGIPENRIIEAHGSFATQRCIDCKVTFDDLEMKKNIKDQRVPRCKGCKGLVKPDIVFFGEALPDNFHSSIFKLVGADLLIIIGTSLAVHPFASLTDLVPETCPRVLINLESVGDIGNRPNDVTLLGKCDDIVQQLCRYLKWEDDLERLWAETEFSLDVDEEKEEPLEFDTEAEVHKLTQQVAETLKLVEHLKKDTESLNESGKGETPKSKEGTLSDSERAVQGKKFFRDASASSLKFELPEGTKASVSSEASKEVEEDRTEVANQEKFGKL